LDGPADGHSCVLSGSLGATVALWEPQLAAFAPRLRTIRYDQPGHGGSPVPAEPISIEQMALGVVALLDRLGLERASFCGLSLGGCVGMWLAAHVPERVERLVLACTVPRFGTRESWLERAATVRTGGTAVIADAVLERWASPAFAGRDALRAQLLSIPAEGYARCCEALADFDARGYLDRIEAPTLVVHGADDPSVSTRDLELLTDGIRDSRLVVVPGARHLANVEQPRAFADAVLEFLGA
jgi:3-oxoadipate enol-lactonase